MRPPARKDFSSSSQDEGDAAPGSFRQRQQYHAEFRHPELEAVRALGRVTAYLSPRSPTTKESKASKDSSTSEVVHYRPDDGDACIMENVSVTASSAAAMQVQVDLQRQEMEAKVVQNTTIF